MLAFKAPIKSYLRTELLHLIFPCSCHLPLTQEKYRNLPLKSHSVCKLRENRLHTFKFGLKPTVLKASSSSVATTKDTSTKEAE